MFGPEQKQSGRRQFSLLQVSALFLAEIVAMIINRSKDSLTKFFIIFFEINFLYSLKPKVIMNQIFRFLCIIIYFEIIFRQLNTICFKHGKNVFWTFTKVIVQYEKFIFVEEHGNISELNLDYSFYTFLTKLFIYWLINYFIYSFISCQT